jgi:uncharacterized protein YycO
MIHRLFNKEQTLKKGFKYKAGDFWIGHNNTLPDRIVHILSRSDWNHAGLIIDSTGNTIEVTEGGIKRIKLRSEKENQIVVVRLKLNSTQRRDIVDYAQSQLKKRVRFSFASIFCNLLHKTLGWQLVIKVSPNMICSEFVANALIHGGVNFDTSPTLITPADLYQKFVQ